MTTSSGEKLFIAIDGNAIVHRAFHAYPASLMTRDGLQVNAVYGFATMLLEVLKRFDPEYIVCTFDTAAPTFRHVQYTEYKAQRKPHEQALIDQFPLVEQVVKAFNIPIMKKEGYEADDLLGTMAQYVKTGKWANQGLKMVIVSGDRDLLQLISNDVNVCLPQGGFNSLTVFNRTATHEKYGYFPEQVIDYKGIVGDASDNIPGIKGVGDKSALGLLEKYGSFDEIYKHIDELKPKQQVLFREGIEQAEFSRQLATIKTDVEMDVALQDCVMKDFKRKDVEDVFVRFEFRSLMGRIPQSNESLVRGVEAASPQLGMFGEVASDKLQVSNGKGKSVGAQLNDSGAMFGQGAAVQDGDMAKLKIVGQNFHEDELQELINGGHEFDFINIPDDETVDGVGLLGLRVKVGGEQNFIVVHTLTESVAKMLVNCFTQKVNRQVARETYFYQWEGFVSRVKKMLSERQFDSMVADSYRAIFDVALAAHYLSSGRRDYSFSSLCFDLLGVSIPQKRSISETVSLFGLLDKIVVKEEEQFNERDGHFNNIEEVMGLKLAGDDGISRKELMKYVENRCSVALASMENRGVLVDVDAVTLLRDDLAKRVAEITQEIYYLVGHEFNINSPKQLSNILFSQLQIQTTAKAKQANSTRESILLELEAAPPVIPKVLEYRTVNKLLTTYADPFVELVNKSTEKMKSCDGKDCKIIHTDFKQTGASSGRLSSNNPNLQNIPAQGDWAKRFRDIFVAREGTKLVSIDYSQIEFRVMADFSDDTALVGDFAKKHDVHKAAAARIFNKDEKDVTPEERQRAKTINFGILYGLTPFGLSRQLKIDQKTAAEYIKEYFLEYSGVAKYIDNAAIVAQEKGYVETLLGRRRYILGLDSKNAAVRNASIREAINMPLQGTAADLVKLAMLKVYDIIEQKYDEKVYILLQIHDELVFEASTAVLKEFETDAQAAMTDVVKFKVPLEVHVSDGDRMSQLK